MELQPSCRRHQLVWFFQVTRWSWIPSSWSSVVFFLFCSFRSFGSPQVCTATRNRYKRFFLHQRPCLDLQDSTVVWRFFLLAICGITQSGGGLEESFYLLAVTPTAAVKPERPATESRPESCESKAESTWMFSTYIQSNFISHSSASVMTQFSGFPQIPPKSLRDTDGLRSGMRALAYVGR